MLDIFLVQMESVLSDDADCKAKNFAKVRALLDGSGVAAGYSGKVAGGAGLAAGCSGLADGCKRPRLIILPEMFATGYLPKHPENFAEDFNCSKAAGDNGLAAGSCGMVAGDAGLAAGSCGLADGGVEKVEGGIVGETVKFLQDLADEKNAFVFGTGIAFDGKKMSEGSSPALYNHSAVFAPKTSQKSSNTECSQTSVLAGEGDQVGGATGKENQIGSAAGKENLVGCATGKEHHVGRGEVSGYHKVHPFFPELNRGFAAGQNITLFTIGDWKIASVICYDLRFPELFRDAVKLGANLITVQAAWPKVRKAHWETLLRARAIENQVYIAAVNGVSPSECDPTKQLAGTSMLIDPLGNVIVSGSDFAEEIIRGQVHLEPLKKYRQDFPVLQGIAPQETALQVAAHLNANPQDAAHLNVNPQGTNPQGAAHLNVNPQGTIPQDAAPRTSPQVNNIQDAAPHIGTQDAAPQIVTQDAAPQAGS